mmetsp:Transcript_8992/g.7997  ORF Transcript_8992/g.7997 Transcript_8992/m.7997 type:complete len:81 (+) Transcript_8992:223-465(+)
MNLSMGLYVIPMLGEWKLVPGIVFAIVSILLFITFITATLRNPGYLKRDPTIDFQNLLDNTDPYNICPDCKVIRTPRSRH